MLSTLLMYPRCSECGGNLPFVSRRYALSERERWRIPSRRLRGPIEITQIACHGCGANFAVQERGFGLVLVAVAAVCGVAWLGGSGHTPASAGYQYLFGGSVLALLVAWLTSHRMTVLTLSSRGGEPADDDPQVADVFAHLEARDAQLEQQQEERRDTLVATEAAWAADEARTVDCPRCGTSNGRDFEKCWSCEAALSQGS